MLCTNCGRDCAKNFIRKADGRELTLTLCSDCYARLYPEQGTEDFFTSFVGRTNSRKKACPDCGTTLDDFRRTGLLGCAYCYTAFREELMPTIRYVQGKANHEGKSPNPIAEEKYDLIRELVREQEILRHRIKEAEHARDMEEVTRLKARLDAVARQLYDMEESR